MQEESIFLQKQFSIQFCWHFGQPFPTNPIQSNFIHQSFWFSIHPILLALNEANKKWHFRLPIKGKKHEFNLHYFKFLHSTKYIFKLIFHLHFCSSFQFVWPSFSVDCSFSAFEPIWPRPQFSELIQY